MAVRGALRAREGGGLRRAVRARLRSACARVAVVLLALALAAPAARAGAFGNSAEGGAAFERSPASGVGLERSPAALAMVLATPQALRDQGLAAETGGAAHASTPAAGTLGSERARILLRSLTVPGWGQATLGHRTASAVFLMTETGVWASFTAFRIQEALRRDSYERTARILAGIDLSSRDEEFRRIVGSYLSSDEYNRLVVARDAANLYYSDPAAMRAYIDQHSLTGKDAWDWGDADNLLRFREQRKASQRAAQRANTALAVAIANRLVSALHAARGASKLHSLRLDVTPLDARGQTAFRLGVHGSF